VIYKKTKIAEGDESEIIRRINADGSSSFIPHDLGNRDWIEYQNWLIKGNIPREAD
jgi:hypothetical protein